MLPRVMIGFVLAAAVVKIITAAIERIDLERGVEGR